MNSPVIRAAVAKDVGDIYAVHRDSVVNLCAGHYTQQQIEGWLDGRDPSMYLAAVADGAIWVADDGGICGFVETAGEEVTKLFVRGHSAGGGVGAMLLAHAVSKIANGGHARAYLEATTNARPFYERHGFEVVGQGRFSHGRSQVELEIVKMERRLARGWTASGTAPENGRKVAGPSCPDRGFMD
ncbi:TPA: GNAT family N-acetyltransferase [Burkholderia aenigmatica]|uniref:GNAT family N-acetyltransferase n=1 Tax=Burkholderia sp. AU45251 TaxID=3059204 RepID=UPI002653A97D|nr:GNAT family N-acetyltransferase [Burkholderia sp. AU45251]HDR9482265.1 GNAT family N-acetyltransferase [Burkholderia aenigmatica]MDN7515098.1 GNAT family N-acetyltransferase [Burkholderia sp. AU45251]HDR9514571.1 GNAT family N-acetyltransferase [Burkholderia aenigmatica]HDR9590636.1 GNAT family N-acetyltransferase [Burkholderia aenigmatica]HDR9599792.1 GNAT family N-acetyltransferase [Burkholderia aenigmatica]